MVEESYAILYAFIDFPTLFTARWQTAGVAGLRHYNILPWLGDDHGVGNSRILQVSSCRSSPTIEKSYASSVALQ